MDDLGPIDTTPVLQQRLAWDIVPCTSINEDMWHALGLLPPSQDVADAAHAESHERLSQCNPLVPFTEVHTALVADLVTKMMVKFQTDKMNGQYVIPEQFMQTLVKQNTDVIHAAIYPLLAAMMEAGIITYGPALGNVLGM